MRQLLKLIPLLIVLMTSGNRKARAALYLVKDGQPTSAIIVDSTSPVAQMAANELQHHLQRASGAKISIISAEEATKLSPDYVRIFIGDSPAAKSMGIDTTQLPVDTYVIKSQGNKLLCAGHDTKNPALDNQTGGWNAATVWAVSQFLDEQLGVRWLWPGEVGTYIPPQKTIPLPELNITTRPSLAQRIFRISLYRRTREGSPAILDKKQHAQVQQEAFEWLMHLQDGSRSTLTFGHSFGSWWEKYHVKRPDFFAVPPPGSDYKMPWPLPNRVKLNLSNPAVDDTIIAEWKAAGAPDNWNVSPNDGTGFDTSAATRAMDIPQSEDLENIWRGNTNLTARYVKFWNRLIAKMRLINPRITLSTYAYSAYNEPPPGELKLDPSVILQVVPHYWAYNDWEEWQSNGSKVLLRPNWWHMGAIAPIIPLHEQGKFFKFAQQHNMAGFSFDTLNGHWATQGSLYYVIARLSVHPEMSVDQIIDEYCSAFGKAAPVIKEYLNYWETFTTKAAYPAPGFATDGPGVTKGLYAQAVEAHNLPSKNSLTGSYPVIPYLYTDEVLNPAYALLDRAAQITNADDPYITKRIQFLRDGLDHLKLTRDVLKLGYAKSLTPQEQTTYVELTGQLQQMRRLLTTRHVLWGEVQNWYEARYGVPTMPGRARSEINRVEDA